MFGPTYTKRTLQQIFPTCLSHPAQTNSGLLWRLIQLSGEGLSILLHRSARGCSSIRDVLCLYVHQLLPLPMWTYKYYSYGSKSKWYAVRYMSSHTRSPRLVLCRRNISSPAHKHHSYNRKRGRHFIFSTYFKLSEHNDDASALKWLRNHLGEASETGSF